MRRNNSKLFKVTNGKEQTEPRKPSDEYRRTHKIKMDSVSQTKPDTSADSAFDYCETEVRANDPDRYFAVLFASADKRRSILSLYALDGELKRVRRSVRNPVLGEIRLQWWSDAIGEMFAGNVREQPVARALSQTIAQTDLSKEPLIRLTEAYFGDLAEYDSRSAAEIAAFADQSSGTLMQLTARLLGGDDTTQAAACDAGAAMGMVDFVLSVPSRGPQTESLERQVPALCDLASERLETVRGTYGTLSAACLPAFIPATLAAWRLRRLQRDRFPDNLARAELGSAGRLLRLYRAALWYRLRNR